MKKAVALFVLILFAHLADAQPDTLGWRLEHYQYPYPVKYMKTVVQNEPVEIAYMDERPAPWNGKTVLLLHGKNFPAAYWAKTIKTLNTAGYRVIAPDALGFGKSSKPEVQYTFSLLAMLTKQLLDTLNVDKIAIIGHSTGGMLATRFTLQYSYSVSKLILADAIGLEDWRAKGAPYRKVDKWYNEERNSTYNDILTLHKQYYTNWKEEYRQWADIQYGMAKSANADQYAWVSALTYDMIFTQPVLYEFNNIKVPTLVIVGKEDKTKIAHDAPPAITAKMGNYKELGKTTAAAIPGAKLIEYDNSGHLPFFEREQDFYRDVLSFLSIP